MADPTFSCFKLALVSFQISFYFSRSFTPSFLLCVCALHTHFEFRSELGCCSCCCCAQSLGDDTKYLLKANSMKWNYFCYNCRTSYTISKVVPTTVWFATVCSSCCCCCCVCGYLNAHLYHSHANRCSRKWPSASPYIVTALHLFNAADTCDVCAVCPLCCVRVWR